MILKKKNFQSFKKSLVFLAILLIQVKFFLCLDFILLNNKLVLMKIVEYRSGSTRKVTENRHWRLLNGRRIYLAWMPATRVTTTPLAPWPESIESTIYPNLHQIKTRLPARLLHAVWVQKYHTSIQHPAPSEFLT